MIPTFNVAAETMPQHSDQVKIDNRRTNPEAGGHMKECPLCGETMRLVTRERTDKLAGFQQTATRQVREWICPECDYWEEAESGEE
jgi:uncharacterized protein with PIN domain